jgi:hypothetical protein
MSKKTDMTDAAKKKRKFMSASDMAEIKEIEALHFALLKRKGKPISSFYVIKCGCGDPGCIYFIDGPEHGTKRLSKKKAKKISVDEYFALRYGTTKQEAI